MLRESVFVDREDTCWIKREVVRLVRSHEPIVGIGYSIYNVLT